MTCAIITSCFMVGPSSAAGTASPEKTASVQQKKKTPSVSKCKAHRARKISLGTAKTR